MLPIVTLIIFNVLGINSLVDTPKLRSLLAWVEKITDKTPGDFQPVGKRAISLAYANANAYANAIVHANAYTLANVYGYAFANANAHAFALDKFIDYAQESQKFQIYQNVNFTSIIATLKKLKQQIPDEGESKNVRLAFGKRIIKTWLEAFHLTPEMVDLSKSELGVLDNYLYANLLMVQCKEAAVSYSKKTWSEIESQMLLPVREMSQNHRWWQRLFG